MDTMFKLGRKVVFTKDMLDARLGVHDEEFYSTEQFITIGEQRYTLRGKSREAKEGELAWDYSELFEVTRDQVTAYHITTDYQDMMAKDLEERTNQQAQEGGQEKPEKSDES